MADKKDTDGSDTPVDMTDGAGAPEPESKGASAKKVEEAAAELSDEYFEDLDETTEAVVDNGSESLEAAFEATTSADEIEDAEVLDEITEDIEAAEPVDAEDSELTETDAEVTAEADISAADDAAEVETEAGATQDGEAADEGASPDGDVQPEMEPASEDITSAEPPVNESADTTSKPLPEPERAHQTAAAPAPVEVKRVGFFPVLLGGVIAAGLGAGALYYSADQGWLGGDTSDLEAQIEALQSELATQAELVAAQTAEIVALKTTLAEASEAEAAQDSGIEALVGSVETAIGELDAADSEMGTAIAELTALLDETRDRLGTLEVQPIPEAEIPEEVRAAFQRQLDEALASLDGRFDQMRSEQDAVMEEIAADMQGQLDVIEAAQAEASAAEIAALEAADAAAARTAAAQIALALDTGLGFAEPLATLVSKSGLDAPPALSAVAEDGAASLAGLQESFPIAARAVLDALPRDAGTDGAGNSLTSVLLTQLGARSLEPREGNDPDAILSRAEAALKSGDLGATLAEVAMLPEDGQAIVAEWVSQAMALRDAKAASADITTQLNAD